MCERSTPQHGDVLSSTWVAARHDFEEATDGRVAVLEARISELEHRI